MQSSSRGQAIPKGPSNFGAPSSPGRTAGRSPQDSVRRVWNTPKITPLPLDLLACYGGSLGTGKPAWTSPAMMQKTEAAEEVDDFDIDYEARAKSNRRKNLSRAEVVEDLMKSRDVGKLQVAMGEVTPAKLRFNRQLVAACGQCKSIDHVQSLLAAHANPLTCDAHGNVALHVTIFPELVAELIKAEPKAISIRNWDGRTPLEEQCLRLKTENASRFTMLQAWRTAAGANPFFQISPETGRTPYGLLSADERDSLKLAPGWPVIQAAVQISDAVQLTRSLRNLRAKCGEATEGMMQYHLFAEPGPDEHRERVCLVWDAIRILLRASAGCQPESFDLSDKMIEQCQELGRWLLVATRGGKAFGNKNTRAPYLTDYADCVVELQQNSFKGLQKLYNELEDTTAGDWLVSHPPMKEVSGDVELPFGYRLRMDLDLKAQDFEELRAPSWPHDCDLGAALADLEQLNVALPAADIVANAPKEVNANDIQSLFAWLHARWLQAICESVREECFQKIKTWFDAFHPVQAIIPDKCKSHEQVWTKAKYYLETMNKKNVDAKNVDTERAKATPAYFVCDILEIQFVYASAEDIQKVYQNLEALTWAHDRLRLVKTQNLFHERTLTPAGGYRDLKVWIAIETSAGPFVTEVILHLADFYKDRYKMLLPFECFRGTFETEGEQKKQWKRLLEKLRKLREAEDRAEPDRLLEAIEEARNAGCSMARLCKARRNVQKYRSALSWLKREEEIRLGEIESYHQTLLHEKAANKAFNNAPIKISSVADDRITHLQRLQQKMQMLQEERYPS